MNTYKSEDIRNVAILGHGGCGKTTLIEATAFANGIISRMGRVEDGTTISDYDKEEIKRGFSISTSLIPIEYNGIKYNFLDAASFCGSRLDTMWSPAKLRSNPMNKTPRTPESIIFHDATPVQIKRIAPNKMHNVEVSPTAPGINPKNMSDTE